MGVQDRSSLNSATFTLLQYTSFPKFSDYLQNEGSAPNVHSHRLFPYYPHQDPKALESAKWFFSFQNKKSEDFSDLENLFLVFMTCSDSDQQMNLRNWFNCCGTHCLSCRLLGILSSARVSWVQSSFAACGQGRGESGQPDTGMRRPVNVRGLLA